MDSHCPLSKDDASVRGDGHKKRDRDDILNEDEEIPLKMARNGEFSWGKDLCALEMIRAKRDIAASEERSMAMQNFMHVSSKNDELQRKIAGIEKCHADEKIQQLQQENEQLRQTGVSCLCLF